MEPERDLWFCRNPWPMISNDDASLNYYSLQIFTGGVFSLSDGYRDKSRTKGTFFHFFCVSIYFQSLFLLSNPFMGLPGIGERERERERRRNKKMKDISSDAKNLQWLKVSPGVWIMKLSGSVDFGGFAVSHSFW